MRSIRRALSTVPRDGTVVVNGNATAAWLVSSIPVRMQAEIKEEARRRGYVSEEHILQAPPTRWEPPVPLAQIDTKSINHASALQRALRPTIERLNSDLATDVAEITNEGIANYRRVFGHVVTKRHFDRLIKRTLDRDHGAEDWSRLELFLPDRIATKRAPVVPIGFDESWRALFDIVEQFQNVTGPTHNELCLFWDAAFSTVEEFIREGDAEKGAKRKLRDLIESKMPFVRSKGRALERLIARKLARWREGGKTAAALSDLRQENSGREKAIEVPDDFRQRLLARAHQNCGHVAQSWREAIKEGWMPPEVAKAYPFDWEHKSYVPAAIRNALGTDLGILEALQIGPQKARLAGPYITRDYTGLASGKVFSADDLTAPIWFWIPDDNGNPALDSKGKVILTRGQCIPWICARSQYVITAQLIPGPGYDSVEILRGIARVHDEYGLPEVLYFERGIWRSRLIDGSIQDRGPWADYAYGLSTQGVTVRHAKPRNPRSKIVENVIGAIQRPMNRERGYAGRRPEECPEETKRQLQTVLRGDAHPGEFFYSHPEMVSLIARICDDFNEEPQNGAMLDGLSPRQAFEKFRESPPIEIPVEFRYLLARSRIETTVKANGVRVGKFFYKGEAAGALIGQRVIAWFNAEDPETICVTDLNSKNPVTLGRDIPVAAFDATPEELERAERLNHAQTKYQRTLYATLKKNFSEEFLRQRRRFVAPACSADLGSEMASQREASNVAARQQEKLRIEGNRYARKIGLENSGRRLDEGRVDAFRGLDRAGIKAANPYSYQEDK